MKLSSLQAIPRCFHTTRWSLVRQATADDSAEALDAMETLCEAYWYPLYAFIRRSGYSPEDAEDLTQGFFARMLDRDILTTADPGRGKLRTFLLTCLRRFLAHETERRMAQKRGAGLIVSMDTTWAENRYLHEPVDHLTPDRLYQRRWALTVLEHTLRLLKDEYEDKGKGVLFEHLRPYLGLGVEPEQSYEAMAAKLGQSLTNTKTQVFRLRQRWRELLFEQVSMTLDDPSSEEIKAELSELMQCL
ncbi:RNA polymerase sigma-70 factor, ECF subfamily [Prosthecobacter debontii]|uniref:RNA polymerase sigma-70 factor, ECF subfamily n=1 Tax=Prosthecobacter debontii TaxID=48467 RepID=A0A1T4YC49_9BACT|nr:sigma factor [Prosthecobacter debontii]SKA99290.1 RNA polymerase sigma-70 factor, ECF subfamily [Prosthecobacter debontii]